MGVSCFETERGAGTSRCGSADLLAMKCNRSLLLLAWLVLLLLGAAAGRYRGGYQRRRYVRRFRPRPPLLHYQLPKYQRVLSRPVVALSGVGYVANSGGAIHVV